MDNKRVADDLLKKVDGHFEELRGQLLEAEGEHVKGGMATVGGKMENKAADIDISTMKAHDEFEKHIEHAKKKISHDIQHALE